MSKIDNEFFLKVLEEEMEVAQGCTEPIAGAYVGAIARKHLKNEPISIKINASKNIIKNNPAKSAKTKCVLKSIFITFFFHTI